MPDLTPYVLTEADRAAVDTLRAEKYSTWDWNFGSAPRYTWSRAAKFPFGLVDARLDVDRGVIRSAVLYGDYFGQLDSAGLSQRLVGLPHRREAPPPGGLHCRQHGRGPALHALPIDTNKNTFVTGLHVTSCKYALSAARVLLLTAHKQV